MFEHSFIAEYSAPLTLVTVINILTTTLQRGYRLNWKFNKALYRMHFEMTPRGNETIMHHLV